ncbi:hypothetical protein [Mucilaginibacter conchicola]|uniref:hypothetical protein n=1 Tax=Mucilaginibacter conchicola TaxID=2303333 RepID=UPI0013143A68|nr:hypothetical protein [Mucilaginibacter conchicola]
MSDRLPLPQTHGFALEALRVAALSFLSFSELILDNVEAIPDKYQGDCRSGRAKSEYV